MPVFPDAKLPCVVIQKQLLPGLDEGEDLPGRVLGLLNPLFQEIIENTNSCMRAKLDIFRLD
jgi:hypothetical protein